MASKRAASVGGAASARDAAPVCDVAPSRDAASARDAPFARDAVPGSLVVRVSSITPARVRRGRALYTSRPLTA
jgi:hypothetical protein